MYTRHMSLSRHTRSSCTFKPPLKATVAPEFQLTVVLISSPLAMLVALWGMTTARMLQRMQSNRRQMGTTLDALLRGTG